MAAFADKPIIVFLFGSEPDPHFLERAVSLHESGRYDVKFAYWKRGAGSSIHIPFSKVLPEEAFLPIDLADPRGNILRRFWLTGLFAWKVWRIKRRFKSRLRAFYCVNINMCAVASLVLLFNSKVGLIHDFQDQFGENLNFLFRFLYRWSARKVVLTILQSENYYKYIELNGLEEVSNPSVIMPMAPVKWSYEYSLKPDKKELVVGYFGYMRGQAILDSLIDACHKVRAEGRAVRLKFAGAGDCAEHVEKRSGEADFIEFSGAFEYFSEYMPLFSSADVIFGVFPTSIYTFRHHVARRFAEAVVSGVPVIVAQGTFMDGLVSQYKCGWSVREAVVDDLAQLLKRLCDDRSELDMSAVPQKFRDHWKFETHEPQFQSAIGAALGI